MEVGKTLEEFHFFPTAVYRVNEPSFLDLLREVGDEALQQARSEPLDVVHPANRSWSFHKDARLVEFRDFLIATTYNILQSQGYDTKTFSLFFTEMWYQELFKGADIEAHIHGNSNQMSAFYFVDTPEGSPRFTLFDNRPGKCLINLPENDKNNVTLASDSVNFVPKAGDLYFINSYAMHKFTRNYSDEAFRFVHINMGSILNYEYILPTP